MTKNLLNHKPLDIFKNMIKNNYFSKEYQQFFDKLKLESLEELKNSYQSSYSHYKNNLQQYFNYFNEKNQDNSEDELDQENNLFEEFASFDTTQKTPPQDTLL